MSKRKSRLKKFFTRQRIKSPYQMDKFPIKCLKEAQIKSNFYEKPNITNSNNFVEDQYIYALPGDNTYQFGIGYDVIDYSFMPESISLIRGGTVEKGALGKDTFIDFYDKIIATNNSNDWIDGESNGGFIADLEINLSKNTLNINNLPVIGSISSEIEKFENISGSNNSDYLVGDFADNKLLGNSGNDYLSGRKGKDQISGGDGNDVLKGGKGDDQLFGGSGNDLIEGGLGKDILNGGEGADIFIYKKAKESKILNKKFNDEIDWIQDFNTKEDKIYFDYVDTQESLQFLGDLDYLSSRHINNALKKSSFWDFDVITFNLKSTDKTYLMVNGSQKGFQAKKDLIVEITGYVGDLENINIINTDQYNNQLIT